MKVEVRSQIPAGEKIAVAFDRLPLVKALKSFGDHTNYVYPDDCGQHVRDWQHVWSFRSAEYRLHLQRKKRG